jgi:2'-hydroxyisoflavone reductase
LFEHLEQLRGDRDGDLDALKGRTWDVVIDTSGYVPRIVRDSATLLAENVKQYIFISSVSVYASNAKPNADEDAPVGTLDDPTIEQVTGATFGPLKALCEQAAEEAMPGRVANIRPGLIVGKRDGSDRFTYWPVRIDRGGDVLCPSDGSDSVQIIDVMDLGKWIVHVAEKNITGVFNALGPKGGMPMRTMLEACQDVSDNASNLVWVDAEFLAQHGVRAWSDMPAWVPAIGGSRGFGTRSCARAIAAGLTFRPIRDTCAETLKWFKTLPDERQKNLRAGISAERETEVLKAWRARG